MTSTALAGVVGSFADGSTHHDDVRLRLTQIGENQRLLLAYMKTAAEGEAQRLRRKQNGRGMGATLRTHFANDPAFQQFQALFRAKDACFRGTMILLSCPETRLWL